MNGIMLINTYGRTRVTWIPYDARGWKRDIAFACKVVVITCQKVLASTNIRTSGGKAALGGRPHPWLQPLGRASARGGARAGAGAGAACGGAGPGAGTGTGAGAMFCAFIMHWRSCMPGLWAHPRQHVTKGLPSACSRVLAARPQFLTQSWAGNWTAA
eukprot:scaffold5248_cov17-Prasinocladus_malaysianus.AAC.2